jgi:hypothetical protein
MAVLSFNLAQGEATTEAIEARQRAILERVRGVPGVERATLTNAAPLSFGGYARTVFMEGQDASDARNGRFVSIAVVGDGYFETSGIPLLGGRDFGPADTRQSPQVVVINETMAERFWPGEDAIGQRFRFFGQEQVTQVVGLARDSKYNTVGEPPQPFIYQPLAQAPEGAVTLLLRSASPGAALATVRAVVQQMEPTTPLTGVATMETVLDQGLWAPRMGATLLGVFGALALAPWRWRRWASTA